MFEVFEKPWQGAEGPFDVKCVCMVVNVAVEGTHRQNRFDDVAHRLSHTGPIASGREALEEIDAVQVYQFLEMKLQLAHASSTS